MLVVREHEYLCALRETPSTREVEVLSG